MYIRIIIAAAVITAAAWVGAVFGQTEDEALFKRGLSEYRLEKFEDARITFRNIVDNHMNSLFQAEARVMLAKSLYRLKSFNEADSVVTALRKFSPRGQYTEWTYYLDAACKFRNGDPRGALVLLSWLAGTTQDSTLRANSIRALQFTIRPSVDPGEFQADTRKYSISAEILATAKPYDESSLLPESIEKVTPPLVAAQDELSRPDTGGPLRIGLLVPSTGKNSEYGAQLLRGVKAAFAGRDSVAGHKVELLVEDTESDPVVTVLKVRKLAEQGVTAIIGPVFSLSNITGAVESNAHGIPFFAPTATDTGLTAIGRYIYQLNFTPAIQAEALAGFAAGMDSTVNAAIIASKDSWGQEVAHVFAREAEKRNVKIIRTDYFNPDSDSSDDINAIMRNLRKIAPKPEAFTDSTNAMTKIAIADTAEVDSTLYTSVKLNPIDTINAVFISATAPDAIKIASKLMEFNIITTLLGDSGWNRPNVPEEGRQYVEGACLVAPPGLLSLGLGPVFQQGQGWNDDRLTVAMKGYDAGMLILHCIEKGAKDPESLAETVATVQDFQGSASRISIHPTLHTNTAVNFVRIHNRMYEKVLPAADGKR